MRSSRLAVSGEGSHMSAAGTSPGRARTPAADRSPRARTPAADRPSRAKTPASTLSPPRVARSPSPGVPRIEGNEPKPRVMVYAGQRMTQVRRADLSGGPSRLSAASTISARAPSPPSRSSSPLRNFSSISAMSGESTSRAPPLYESEDPRLVVARMKRTHEKESELRQVGQRISKVIERYEAAEDTIAAKAQRETDQRAAIRTAALQEGWEFSEAVYGEDLPSLDGPGSVSVEELKEEVIVQLLDYKRLCARRNDVLVSAALDALAVPSVTCRHTSHGPMLSALTCSTPLHSPPAPARRLDRADHHPRLDDARRLGGGALRRAQQV